MPSLIFAPARDGLCSLADWSHVTDQHGAAQHMVVLQDPHCYLENSGTKRAWVVTVVDRVDSRTTAL